MQLPFDLSGGIFGDDNSIFNWMVENRESNKHLLIRKMLSTHNLNRKVRILETKKK